MNNEEHEFDNIEYSYRFLFSFKWFFGIFLLVSFIIVSHIPIASKLDSIIYSSLNVGQTCQLRISDYHFEFFAPKIRVKNIVVPGNCFSGKLPGGLKIPEVKVYFRGISFSPLGLSTKIVTNVLNSEIEAFVIPGMSSLSVILESDSDNGKFTTDINKLRLSELNTLIPQAKFSGDLYVSNFLLEMSYSGKITDFVLNLTSNNVNLPAQTINIPSPMGAIPLSIDEMAINSLLLQVVSPKANKFNVKKMILGDEESPVKAKFTGDISLAKFNIAKSKLNLKGQLGFSEEFLEKFSIISLALGSFDKKDNFYQIQLKGTFDAPKPSSAR